MAVSASDNSSTGPKAITEWPTGKKLIALTYDDGPTGKYTPKYLEMLNEKHVPATFFLLGEQIREFPSIAKRTIDMGFEVGNHTYDHKSLNTLSEESVRSEMGKTEDLLTSLTGNRVSMMRPPYGAANPRVRTLLANELGYKIVLWDVDTNDWRGRSTENIVQNIMANAHDGSIVLMHDRYQTSLDASRTVIDGLREKGFEFVTVSQLLASPRVARVQNSASSAKDPATSATSTRRPSGTKSAARSAGQATRVLPGMDEVAR